MTIQVGYRYSGGSIQVGYWLGAAAGTPAITAVSTVQNGSTFTITGTDFDASGNTVRLNDIPLPLDSESATSITVSTLDASIFPYSKSIGLQVINSAGDASNVVQVTVQPANGEAYAVINQAFLGDSTRRTYAVPDYEIGDEIRIRAVTGTGVTEADVTINGQGAEDVDQNVTSHEFAVFDGELLSNWATVTWNDATPTLNPPDVRNLLLASAVTACSDVGLVATVTNTLPSDTVLAGYVIDQFPLPTDTVDVGSTVELTVSSGRNKVLVPIIEGLQYVDAVASLLSGGLTKGAVTVTYDSVGGGIVQHQGIAPGTFVDYGTPIDFIINSLTGSSEEDIVLKHFGVFRGTMGLLTGARLDLESVVGGASSTGQVFMTLLLSLV